MVALTGKYLLSVSTKLNSGKLRNNYVGTVKFEFTVKGELRARSSDRVDAQPYPYQPPEAGVK